MVLFEILKLVQKFATGGISFYVVFAHNMHCVLQNKVEKKEELGESVPIHAAIVA